MPFDAAKLEVECVTDLYVAARYGAEAPESSEAAKAQQALARLKQLAEP
jgi:hypothetical protein